MEHIITLSEENVEILNVKGRGISIYHSCVKRVGSARADILVGFMISPFFFLTSILFLSCYVWMYLRHVRSIAHIHPHGATTQEPKEYPLTWLTRLYCIPCRQSAAHYQGSSLTTCFHCALLYRLACVASRWSWVWTRAVQSTAEWN
jgi:hypothetical protein